MRLQKELWYIPFPAQYATYSNSSLEDATSAIKDYIHDIVSSEKSKWVQLFQRFYDNESELFWKFRNLNEQKPTPSPWLFHEVGDLVQQKIWNLEYILTSSMVKRPTDKTITAFYDHVRLFFPYYDSVGIFDQE